MFTQGIGNALGKLVEQHGHAASLLRRAAFKEVQGGVARDAGKVGAQVARDGVALPNREPYVVNALLRRLRIAQEPLRYGEAVAFVAVAQMQQRLFVLPRKLREDLRLGHEATPFLNEKRFHPKRPI